MSTLPEVFTLSAEDEATRLWVGATHALKNADQSLVALGSAIDLGLRSIEITAIHRLQPVKDRLPATIQSGLETPDPEVEPYRDAVETPHALGFRELLDLLSEADLECVAPSLHRGWEDRRFSCKRSRGTAQQAIGITVTAANREDLLLLLAYRNRMFRYPPPVRVDRVAILKAYPALQALAERFGLVDETTTA